jgi:hypothetical protein
VATDHPVPVRTPNTAASWSAEADAAGAAGWDFFPSPGHIFPRFTRHFFDMIAA